MSPDPSPPSARRTSGFTMLELMVVLVILATAAALVLPARPRGGGALELKGATRAIAAGLRHSREAAVATNRETLFVLDVERRVWRSAGGTEQSLPATSALAFYTAAAERLSGTAADIRFFPDGGSTGGEIRIARGDQAYVVSVNWLTGRVEVRNGR